MDGSHLGEQLSGQLSGLQGQPLSFIAISLAVALVPFVLLSMTSFLKLSVVLNIFKNALGAPQVPSGTVIGTLSLILTLFIMAPVGRATLERVEREKISFSLDKPGALTNLISNLEVVSTPFFDFMKRHSSVKEREFFIQLSHQQQASAELKQDQQLEFKPLTEEELLKEESFFSLLPAFTISQLHQAFMLGLTVLIPFLVVDIILTNILMALGMSMVNPVTITLPVKLFLFVMCDGWFLLCKGLILGYM
jgi:type III secretion protein R